MPQEGVTYETPRYKPIVYYGVLVANGTGNLCPR